MDFDQNYDYATEKTYNYKAITIYNLIQEKKI